MDPTFKHRMDSDSLYKAFAWPEQNDVLLQNMWESLRALEPKTLRVPAADFVSQPPAIPTAVSILNNLLKEQQEAKRALTIQLLGGLRATNPQVAMVTFLDMDQNHPDELQGVEEVDKGVKANIKIVREERESLLLLQKLMVQAGKLSRCQKVVREANEGRRSGGEKDNEGTTVKTRLPSPTRSRAASPWRRKQRRWRKRRKENKAEEEEGQESRKVVVISRLQRAESYRTTTACLKEQHGVFL
ncbi:hypothetical protein EYF80_058831 [Liparis tanakae]|uniref:Uncharacterized protein n=1 Tax=Liparis tanakae TaxID=230148 RepID=A0A4Z2EQ01_9TELE|nr:hypothetical protein EYF80_058831 [Liparis tanakae]